MITAVKLFDVQNENQIETQLRQIKDLGFCYASFGFKNLKTNKVTSCFSHKDWADLYISKALFSHDPLLHAACTTANRTILWSAVSIDSAEGYQVMMNRESMSGAKNGVTLAINNGHFQQIIDIGDDNDESAFLDKFIKNYSTIMQSRNIIERILLGP